MKHKMGITKMEMIYVTAVNLTLGFRKKDRERINECMELLDGTIDQSALDLAHELCIKDSATCECQSCRQIREDYKEKFT